MPHTPCARRAGCWKSAWTLWSLPQSAHSPIQISGQAMLTHLGYDVVSYISSEEALAAFCAAPERFDLVITDQTMPHLTGADLAQALRGLRPDIPIILCIGYSQTMTAEQAEQLGLDAFCMKPLRLRDLEVTIRRVLTQRRARQNF